KPLGARSGVAAEQRDLIQVARPGLLVGDAQATFGSKTQHADLALREVAMHLVGGLTGLLERVNLRKRRMHARFAHHPVRFPRLAIVREMTTLERLEVHPEVAVVV